MTRVYMCICVYKCMTTSYRLSSIFSLLISIKTCYSVYMCPCKNNQGVLLTPSRIFSSQGFHDDYSFFCVCYIDYNSWYMIAPGCLLRQIRELRRSKNKNTNIHQTNTVSRPVSLMEPDHLLRPLYTESRIKFIFKLVVLN